jgi:hypothetical protein
MREVRVHHTLEKSLNQHFLNPRGLVIWDALHVTIDSVLIYMQACDRKKPALETGVA